MMFKPYERKLLFRIILIPLSFALFAWLFVEQYYVYSLLISLFILYQLYEIYHYQKKIYTELEQFKEAIQYRDFSRHFDVKRAPAELQPLREAFNNISDSFKEASREKETQYQYLQQILAIVDTGIISYELSTGDIVWMNEAVKNMLNLPHMKNISALEKRNITLMQEIGSIPVGENKLVALQPAKSQFKILLSATAFQVNQQQFKLITFQNISEALEETEADAWSRLLRVMTHEIMNSIAPISSLADTLKKLVEESIQNNEAQPTYTQDLQVGIDTIRKRSEALLKFADTYRNLNKITTLNLQKIYVRDLFESQSNLMAPTLAQRNIELEIILKDPSVHIEVDSSLLEQVLINLLVNAIDAVKDQNGPKIILTAELDHHKKCIIKVNDNGPGIPAEVLDKIFIPFFSTKKTGSGIGLNLCKQIMMLHKGNIHVHSVEGVGTSFILTV
ncbi:MAG: HAMP domain-containing histidine kinase [Sphingobacteriaceae bacterium]|nr:HAMP domain-containing histidine kinase [Sphingobacteriaceae bacterium]